MGAAARDFVFYEFYERARSISNHNHDDERCVFLDGNRLCSERETMQAAALLFFRTDLYRWRRRRLAGRLSGRVAWRRWAHHYRVGNARACASYLSDRADLRKICELNARSIGSLGAFQVLWRPPYGAGL